MAQTVHAPQRVELTILAGLCGLFLIVASMAFEHILLGVSWRREGIPTWSKKDILAIFGFMSGSFLLAFSMIRAGFSDPSRNVSWSRGDPGPIRSDRIWLAAIVLVAILSVGLLVLAPDQFHLHAREDGVVEVASALLALLAGIMAWVGALNLVRRKMWGVLEFGGLLGFGSLCLLIAGEEVSWLQRHTGYQPEWTGTNQQLETNFHNFATNAFELAYYVGGGFVAMVLLPVVVALQLPGFRAELLCRLAPSMNLVLAGLIIASLNYDMVMSTLIRIAFWGSAGLLLAWWWHDKDPQRRLLLPGWVLVALALQAGCVLFGHQSTRRWDITEYKELLIAAALCMWSMQLWRRTAR